MMMTTAIQLPTMAIQLRTMATALDTIEVAIPTVVGAARTRDRLWHEAAGCPRHGRHRGQSGYEEGDPTRSHMTRDAGGGFYFASAQGWRTFNPVRGTEHACAVPACASDLEAKSPVVVMPPTIVVATTPPVMMPVSTVMAPSVTSAMDLDYGIIRHAERVGRCDGHCRCRQGRR